METRPLPHEQAYEVLSGRLEAQGQVGLLVTGTSMLPFLRDKQDTVMLQRPQGRLRRGQILLYCRRNGSLVLHRLVKPGPERLVMNGDSQTWTEEIRPEQVMAVVTEIRRPDGGRIQTESLGWRLKGGIWQLLRPCRPVIFRLYGRIRRRTGHDAEQ